MTEPVPTPHGPSPSGPAPAPPRPDEGASRRNMSDDGAARRDPGEPASRRLRRHRSGRLVAGVAGGIAEHLDVNVLWVRAAFVALMAVAGAGVVAYGLLWIFVRQEAATVERVVPPRERQQALGLAALGLGVGLAASALGNSSFGWIVGPLGVAVVGAALVWQEADGAQRRRPPASLRDADPSAMPGPAGPSVSPPETATPATPPASPRETGPAATPRVTAGSSATPRAAGERRTGWWAVLRVLTGALFVALGIAVFLLRRLDLGQVQFGLLAVLATLAGVAVLTVPWWVRLVRDLGEERRQRIREAERAAIATHLHDSVLQTLALIQRQSDSPREVARLARGQERELRGWLYGTGGYWRAGAQPAPGTGPADSLTDALATAAAEVEDTYALTVRPVVVGGDRPLDPAGGALRALVLAAREAMVNAAKHAGVDEVSVYAEVEPDEVNVFVRDRGVGFDPAAVPDDRHGLADSVRDRMNRHGGTVRLRTAAGEGTEVHLRMPTAVAVASARGDDGEQRP